MGARADEEINWRAAIFRLNKAENRAGIRPLIRARSATVTRPLRRLNMLKHVIDASLNFPVGIFTA